MCRARTRHICAGKRSPSLLITDVALSPLLIAFGLCYNRRKVLDRDEAFSRSWEILFARTCCFASMAHVFVVFSLQFQRVLLAKRGADAENHTRGHFDCG